MKNILIFILLQFVSFFFYFIILENWNNYKHSGWYTFFAWLALLVISSLIEREGFLRGKKIGKIESNH